MSLKVQSLGAVAGGTAHEGLRPTGGTNATPIVATINATHGLKVGDRVIIAGVTTLTAMNGTFGLSAVAATTATLEGSSGNGAYGGTGTMRAAMDKTPFMQRHSAVGAIQAQSTYDGVVIVESSADNSTYADAKKGVALAATAAGGLMIEVELGAYMRFRSSTAGAAGVASCQLLA